MYRVCATQNQGSRVRVSGAVEKVVPLFDRIRWQDPVSGFPLEPIVSSRTPGGVPTCGALRVAGTREGYPIVDCIARMTPELAWRHRDWLASQALEPPDMSEDKSAGFQAESTVDSFGWQWTWNSRMRSDADLRVRVAEKFRVAPEEFTGKLVLDAGAGAGDQSDYLLRQGAEVVSFDLSSSIEVVARKLRMRSGWVGVQGDILHLPFADNCFDIVYCEGVLQHTRDSAAAVRELCRVLRPGGRILATHYVRTPARTFARRLRRRLTLAYYEALRKRLSRLDRFTLLLITGNLAALSYAPLIGCILRRSGTALYYSLMPDFKTTWTNTFDYYGNHSFQRFVSPEEFRGYFDAAPGTLEIIFQDQGVIVAKRTA